jgi:hypothetical protein
MKTFRLSLLTDRCSLFTVYCLLLTGLTSCGLSREVSPADARATLDAAVQGTVSAQQTAGATAPASPTTVPPTASQPTVTEQPPINVTLQFSTDTPAPTQPPINPSDTPTSTLATPIPPTATTAPADLVRPNGTPVHASRLPVAPTIDGDVSEWASLPNSIDQVSYRPENWTGPADNNAQYALGWDANNLYLAAHVTDDVHVQTELGDLIFKGDSLEILFDADLAGDFDETKLSADDYQLGLTPGENKRGGPDAYLWFPSDRKGRPDGVNVAAFQDESGNGFYLEAAIPWALFKVTPGGGMKFGFILSVSDNDTPATSEQQSLISSVNTRRLVNPTSWGTLILDP